MPHINGTIDFLGTAGGISSSAGKITLIAASGINTVSSNKSYADLVFSNRTAGQKVTNPIEGSAWHYEPSGVAVFRTKSHSFQIMSPIHIGPFYLPNASSLTPISLYYGGQDSTNGVTEAKMPLRGSIIVVAGHLDTAITGGTVIYTVTINGSTAITLTLTVGQKQGYKTVKIGDTTFSAGDTIGVSVNGTISTTPTTFDVASSIYVQYERQYT